MLEKCKSRPQWGIISYQSERPSSKSLQINAGKGVEKSKPSYTLGGNVSLCIHYGKQYGGSSKNKKIKLPYDPVISLLGIYPEKMKTLIRKVHALQCSLHLYLQQPRHGSNQSVNRGMEKDVCINITDYYSVIKEQNNAMWSNMNRPTDYHTKWSKSTKWSKTEKDKYHVISFICEI